jgi:hypothetical protein
MLEEILTAIPICLASMLKFIAGPLGGYAAGLNLFTTILTTVAGTMTVVVAFAFFGDFLRHRVIHRFFPRRKKFSGRNRRFVTVWKKYGLVGVAVLTPLLFTPIGGSLLAVSFGAPKDKLIIYMFVSASFWSVVLSLVVYTLGEGWLRELITIG